MTSPMTKRFSLVCAVLLLAGAGCGSAAPAEDATQLVDLEMPNGEVLSVELALTADQQSKGLSGREDIGDGMLFCMDNFEQRNFWMLGMAVPIDMIWMRSGDVVEISDNVPLREDDKIATRTSSAAVNGVLEVAASRAAELGIEEGTDLPGVREHCNQ